MKNLTLLTLAKERRNSEAECDGGYAVEDKKNPDEERIAVR